MTSVRESIDRAPMSAYQVLVVVICLAIVLAEGFDLLIMAFSASGVAQEWSLSGSEVGILLSAALFGMAFGSAFLAPLADRIGRRMQTLGCLLLVAIAMLLASFSTSFVQLGIWRVLTGLGIGGLAASLPVVVAEFSPQRRRTTMLAIYTIGLPLGGVIGGLIAGALAAYGWRASFAVGAGITFVLFLVVLFAMPESIDYLLVRRPKNALARVNKTLQWMRIAPIAELPAVEHRKDDTVKGAIFTGRNGIRSALLGFVFFVFNAGFYFATSWTPRLLEQTSQSAQQGITGGTLLNLGGAAGALLFGLLALKFRLRWLAAVTVACAALSLVAMSVTLGGSAGALVVATIVGALLNAIASGLYALASASYPAAVRTTAVGWVVAIGRVGAILAPIMAGVLLDGGWTASGLYLFFAVLLLLGAGAIALIRLPKDAEASPIAAAGSDPVAQESVASAVDERP